MGRKKGAFNLSFPYGKIGEFERKTGEMLPDAHHPNRWRWKRTSDQVQRNPLECGIWAKFLCLSERSVSKGVNSKENL